MSLTDSSNPFFQLALRFVNQTNQHIFLTGKAGTGKTTFLKYIKENNFKKMAVVAPTGVAAINAGGVTMHSFFQLPFGPFIPTMDDGWGDPNGIMNEHKLIKNIRFNHAKRELLRELDLLIIDEVSMVRADMMDAIDSILRHFRQQQHLPFGGVQLLYIGDLFQLPPVVNKTEWEILRQYYKSPFFFDAQVLKQAPPVYLELKKIYRQNDAHFIDILNNIRNNQVTANDLENLHQHYYPDFDPSDHESFITLTTHNARADHINQQELNKLANKLFSFEGEVKGDFDEKAFPAEKKLYLKEGAQIMFIKNDKGENRRYFNGKIGNISSISEEEIFIKFPGENEELLLEKETWKNIRYQFNKAEGNIEEETIGTFTQYPIRLAWAITIHKSQGLTFTKAIIDAGASFAPGQVYVALSRLTAMEGMILYSRIDPGSIHTDQRVLEFAQSEMAEDLLLDHLKEEQKIFVIRSVRQAFNWEKLIETFREHYDDYDDRQIPDKHAAIVWAKNLLALIRQQHDVSIKFAKQLEQLLQAAEQDKYVNLQQRISAAADYFIQLLDQSIESMHQHINETKIKQKVKKYVKELRDIEMILHRKKEQLQHAVHIATGLMNGVDMNDILQMEQPEVITIDEVKPDEHIKKEERRKEKEIKTKAKKGDTNRMSLHLFRENKTISEIATLRGLSPITIESHLVSFIPTGEIAIGELVPEEKIDTIKKAIHDHGGNFLSPIKEMLGDNFSYVEIKAVMKYLEKINMPAEQEKEE